jgi:hypothetical protein
VPLPAEELNAYEVSALVIASERLAGVYEAGGVGGTSLGNHFHGRGLPGFRGGGVPVVPPVPPTRRKEIRLDVRRRLFLWPPWAPRFADAIEVTLLAMFAGAFDPGTPRDHSATKAENRPSTRPMGKACSRPLNRPPLGVEFLDA